jgi:8-oxo-dGTP diphosphatase
MTTVTCAIIEKEGKILLARRVKNQELAGKREFPGGKVEDGESHEECLKRELEEEFGIQADVGKFIATNKYHYDHISIELLGFNAK